MRRIVFGALALTGLAACNEPTRPADPAVTLPAAAAAVEQQFTIRNLGTLGGTFSNGIGINERTEVSGFSDLPSGEVRAFLWRPGQGMRSLGTLGGANSFGVLLNDRSEVVGFSEIRPGSDVIRAFLWSQARGMRGLGTLGGENSLAESINNRTEVVGVSENRNGRDRAFLWTPGRGMRSLGTLGGPSSHAVDINDASQVVGLSLNADGHDRAFLWTAARGMEDLGTLGGDFSVAIGISQTGVVVGFSEISPGTGVFEAFLWTRGRGMRSLGTLGQTSIAFGINTHRRVVGSFAGAPGSNSLPFLWTAEGGLRELPTLGGDFGEGSYLNEFGHIVGRTTRASGALRATLWTPTAGPLAVDPTGDAGAAEIAASPGETREATAALCALGRKWGEWSHYGSVASRVCLAIRSNHWAE